VLERLELLNRVGIAGRRCRVALNSDLPILRCRRQASALTEDFNARSWRGPRLTDRESNGLVAAGIPGKTRDTIQRLRSVPTSESTIVRRGVPSGRSMPGGRGERASPCPLHP
jgi:hypothetical protein